MPVLPLRGASSPAGEGQQAGDPLAHVRGALVPSHPQPGDGHGTIGGDKRWEMMDGHAQEVLVPHSPPSPWPEEQDASDLISPLGFCFLPPFAACNVVYLPGLQQGDQSRFWTGKHPEGADPQLNKQQQHRHQLHLTCGLLVPNPRLGVEGTDIECGPMGELMTENGGPMPLMGELRVLMGEWSWPGEPSEEPMPGPMDGWRDGVAMGPRLVGEFRDVEFTWLEKSVREERENWG